MNLDLPDVPRWIEAHGIARDPEAWCEPVAGGAVIGHDRARLAVAVGDAAPAELVELARARPQHTLLFAIERADIADALRAVGRGVERALLHELASPDALPDLDGAEPLGEASIEHVPPQLAAELAWARARGTVWTAWLDGEPASFAYAPWHSARWFDVSVDTLPAARQLGLATVVAAAMIRDERARGREPVWGADEGNLASLRLAERLGFTPVDAIFVAPAMP